MNYRLITAVLVALIFHPIPVDAKIKRSQSAKVEFKQQHPCPTNGAKKP